MSLIDKPKVKFRPSVVEGNQGAIYYQIIHQTKVRQLLTDYKIYPSEWDCRRSSVELFPASPRHAVLHSIHEHILRDVGRLKRIERRLDTASMAYTSDDLIFEFNRYCHEYSLLNYMTGIIARLKHSGKIRTSETYRSALSSFIKFRRGKTGQRLTIKWTKEMQAILDKYRCNTSVYLLPIIRTPSVNERCAYRNIGYIINRNLKTLAPLADVSIPLTMYVARHSWASAAKAKGVPLSIISEGMGHESEATTRIYLASLDTSTVDNANSRILASI